MFRTLAIILLAMWTVLAAGIWISSYRCVPRLFRLNELGLKGAAFHGKVMVYYSFCPTCNELGGKHHSSCQYDDYGTSVQYGYSPPKPPDLALGPVAITNTSGRNCRFHSGWELNLHCWFVFAVSAIGLALTLFWNKSRIANNRRRRGLCGLCKYNLTGNTTGVCPECGTKVATTLSDRNATA